VSDDAPPKARLRGQISALWCRIADENNREFLIVQKELANPTGLLEEVMQEEIRPLQERMRAVIRELLDAHIPDRRVQFCEISVISQCITPMVVRRGGKGKREYENDHPGIDDIEAYSHHVIEFSLGGIGAIRTAGEYETEKLQKSVGERK
jgi:TetR/AcrR family transcriptional regulator, regulator of cefoperazone and chloramphenicol sensitivity